MKNIELFKEGLDQLNIELSDNQIDQFMKYYDLLIESNKVMNLTAITEFEDVIKKHFLDSLALCKAVDLTKEVKILDLGTGAGFPGIPLKIAFPNLEFVLLDSLNKRIKFLNTVIEELGLEKIEAIHARAEEAARKPEYREQFDYCVSRAVANLSTLSEYCIPFVKKGGSFIPYKSGKVEEELQSAKFAINLLGAKMVNVTEFSIPGTDMERSLITILKGKETPKKYPRMGGKPSKEPL